MQKSLINLLLAALISLVASCGGGGGGSNSSAPDNSNNQNTAPSISGSITKIRVGANLDFYPSAYDARMIILHLVFQENPTGRLLNHHLEGYMVFQGW